MPKFQIRDKQFGLALYEAPSSTEALVDFLTDRAKGELRPKVEPFGGGSMIEFGDEVFFAVPADGQDPFSDTTKRLVDASVTAAAARRLGDG